MKKQILALVAILAISFALLVPPVAAYDRGDLDSCLVTEKCYGNDLSEADLSRANFCETIMPDGRTNNDDC